MTKIYNRMRRKVHFEKLRAEIHSWSCIRFRANVELCYEIVKVLYSINTFSCI